MITKLKKWLTSFLSKALIKKKEEKIYSHIVQPLGELRGSSKLNSNDEYTNVGLWFINKLDT